jgi:hypothetical protein
MAIKILLAPLLCSKKLAYLYTLKLQSQHDILFTRGLSLHGLDPKTFCSRAVFMAHRIYLLGNMHVYVND